MIKTVSFDLDGTLVKGTYADLVWLEGLPRIYAEEKGVTFEEAKQFLEEEYDDIGDNREEWYDLEYWFNRYHLKYDWRELLEKYRYAIEVFPEVIGVVSRLSKKIDLIITSNAKREFVEIELEQTRLRKYFTYVFSSTSDFHKVKKITDFYQMVCDKIGINPDELIHIGDHKEFDYLIPKNLGVKSFFLDRKEKSKGSFVVHDLIEFEEIINTLISK